MNNQLVLYKNENEALKLEIERAEQNVVTLENKEDDELDELNKQLSSQAEILYELQEWAHYNEKNLFWINSWSRNILNAKIEYKFNAS